jgi:DNA invertase Pin-like site-specific DNA recombinase
MEGQTTCGCYVRSAVRNGASIEEQLRICRSVATERGYVVDERYVFVDDGVGGLGAPGPGWNSLMELAASDLRPFGAVVMRDASRISRSQEVGEEQFARLRDAGVEVVFQN